MQSLLAGRLPFRIVVMIVVDMIYNRGGPIASALPFSPPHTGGSLIHHGEVISKDSHIPQHRPHRTPGFARFKAELTPSHSFLFHCPSI